MENNHPVLVKGQPSEELLALTTYSRAHGHHGRFFVSVPRLRAWLEDEEGGLFFDTDCGDFLMIRRKHVGYCMTIYWLSTAGNGHVQGICQHLELTEQQMLMLLGDKPFRLLIMEQRGTTHVDGGCAVKTLKTIQTDKLMRRAFSRAMKNCFQWGGNETVRLYSDGPNSFFFRTKSGFPACGGLILQETKVRTPNGSFPKMYYGVHT